MKVGLKIMIALEKIEKVYHALLSEYNESYKPDDDVKIDAVTDFYNLIFATAHGIIRTEKSCNDEILKIEDKK